MKVVFPMTGPNWFADEQHAFPKPLVDVAGRTMFENAVDAFREFDDLEILVAINERDAKDYHLDQVIKRATEGLKSNIRILSRETAGALCTTLLLSDLFGEDELLISNYDHHINFRVADALQYFRAENADFGVISFDSVHPKWSYVRLDETESVIESTEKNPISKHALVGMYYFRSSGNFVKGAKETILSSPSDKDRFYTSEVINALVLAGLKGRCYKIAKHQYRNFYDSSELKDFNEQASVNRGGSDRILANTKLYIRKFDSKDVLGVASLLTEGATLYDPKIGEVVGRAAIVEFVGKLFEEHGKLNFVAKRIVVGEDCSVIEFILTLDSSTIRGIDLITWRDDQIERIEAYLEVQ
ncbi:MAG: nuclear transport factor 2 family protein [Oceanospirillaceae bacterium]|nr:nuclear transport factor 2 family protein [Oceanospirillaceae bacterium]